VLSSRLLSHNHHPLLPSYPSLHFTILIHVRNDFAQPTNNANIEFLGSFDVPKTPFTNEPNELLFSIPRRPQELFNDDDISDNEPSTQGKVVNSCLSTSSSSAQARMTDKKIDSKPWTLPTPPDFKNIFLHTKEEHAAQADVPLAFQLDGELSPLTFFTLFFSDSVCSQIAVNTNAYASIKRSWRSRRVTPLRGYDLGRHTYIPRHPCLHGHIPTTLRRGLLVNKPKLPPTFDRSLHDPCSLPTIEAFPSRLPPRLTGRTLVLKGRASYH